MKCWEARTRHQRCRTRVQRDGTRRRVGDAATRASGRVVPRGSHVVFTDAHRRGFDTRRREPNRANSGLNRPYRPYRVKRPKRPIQAEIQKKKKKNLECTVLLNTNPTSAQFHSKRQNTLLTFRLTHFVSVLSASLFRLPLCLSASVSSPLLHQYILSSALSHAFLTQVSL